MKLDTSQLNLNNRYTILFRVIENTFYYDLNKKKLLREVTVKIGLEKIDTQEGIRLMKFGSKFVLKLGLEFSITSQSYCHTSVTSDNMVTVIVTWSHSHTEYSRRIEK